MRQALSICVVILLGLMPSRLAGDAQREPRAKQVRDAVLALLEQADKDQWPARLAELRGFEGSHLIYTPPSAKVEDYGAVAVVWENFEDFPAGVWVGFGDGHLEFAATRAELADCEAQLSRFQPALAKYGSVFGPKSTREVNPADAAEKLKTDLCIRVVDAKGLPVPGARVGFWGQFGDEWPDDQRVVTFDRPNNRPIITDERGECVVTATQAFNANGNGSTYLGLGVAPLYVLEEGRRLVALGQVRLDEFGTGKLKSINLQPICRVKGAVGSTGLPAGQEMGQVECFAFRPGMGAIRAVFWTSPNQRTFEIPLPEGDYCIYVTAHGCDPVEHFLRIGHEQLSTSLQFDLAPRQSPEVLVGKPAPEFRDLKGWLGEPVTMAGLRGKVVLLDFWGYWCGPCVGVMPEVMKLHDEFENRGLVIVGVHDDSVQTPGELQQKLEPLRVKYWGGRSIPFEVALDGGGRRRIAESTKFTTGATTAAYHVSAWPTTLLVGRDGVVKAEIRLIGDQARAEATKKIIEQLEVK
jgi:thiol-disulfide isomerase/thioredoxin